MRKVVGKPGKAACATVPQQASGIVERKAMLQGERSISPLMCVKHELYGQREVKVREQAQ
ncbi:MAG: hypothetical protein H0X24_05070 [Ktedonobacterales bacterium]|nr:hypothetical protein [Ktedonobacterales bacterium]